MEININKRLIKRSGNTKLDIVGSSTQPLNVTAPVNITGDVAVTGALAASSLATVADPGTGQTITPPTSGADFVCAVTTAGAGETRALGTPTRYGQMAVIRHAVDGGDFTMTNASGWKGGGATDDVATFADDEDTMVVIATGVAAATDWRWIADKGVAIA